MAFELLTNEPVTPPACPPFILTGAVSIKNHTNLTPPPATLAFGVNLPLSPPASAGVEGRTGGPTQVVLTFSEDIAADDESLDPGDEVTANVGVIGSLAISGNRLTVGLTGVPDMRCLVLTVENTPDGITTLGSEPLSGDNDVHVRVLKGDVNGSGSVNNFDILAVRGSLGQLVNAANFTKDVNLSGKIDNFDILQVRGALGHIVACP